MPAAYIKKVTKPLKKPLDLIAVVTTSKKIGKVQPSDATANPMPYTKNERYLFLSLLDLKFSPKLI